MRARRAAGTAAEHETTEHLNAARAQLAGAVPRHGDEPSPVASATRTAAALAFVDARFALPWWLDRQLRPGHAAFVPAGSLGTIENLTGRSWVTLATVTSGPVAVVDPGGAVHVLGSTWSLDWAIGAEDRWHLPAVETTVRQRLVSHAPVVETACKVPSGDATARAYAIATPDGDAVVVEVENESPVPFVVAFSVRPTHPLGVGAVGAVRYEHPHVLVDDRPTLWFDKRVARWAAADAPADALAQAIDGGALDGEFVPVRSATGLATAAFLLPVPHRTSVRVVLFPNATRRDRPVLAGAPPAAGQVARGWEAHVARAARIELPDRRISDAYAVALRTVSAATAGSARSAVAPFGRAGSWRVADECTLVRSLSAIGLGDAAGRLLAARGDELELDSWFRREPASIERNIEIFATIGAYFATTRDALVVDEVLGAAVKAAHWTERARARATASVDEPLARRAAAALGALATAVRACGQPDAADDLDAFGARFVLDLDDDPPNVTPVSDPPAPPRPDAVEHRRGTDTIATLRAALDDCAERDPAVFDRVEWLVRAGGPTSRWPTFAHPAQLGGSGGSGDDPVAAALVVELVRSLAVDADSRANTLLLLPVVPPSWYGQSVDVHDLPTRYGSVSFAVRWHGNRPALLWEIDRPAAASHEPLTIAVPGLDATWSSTEPAGEALLAPPPHEARVAVVAHPDTDHVPMTTLEPRIRRDAVEDRPISSGGSPPAPPTEPGSSFA